MLYADHRNLNQVGVATLDGHVDCFAFERLPFIKRQSMHIREEALPAEERIHVTLFACLMERAINVVFDVWEGLVIAFNELRRIVIAHARDLGQAKGRLPVKHSVHYRFSQSPLIFRHIRHRNTE